MGATNPNTGKYERIVRVITRDGRAARKASDVIAYELESGDQIGDEAFQEFDTQRKKIEEAGREKLMIVERETRSALHKLYKTWTSRTKPEDAKGE